MTNTVPLYSFDNETGEASIARIDPALPRKTVGPRDPDLLAEPWQSWKHLGGLIAGDKRRRSIGLSNADLTTHHTFSTN